MVVRIVPNRYLMNNEKMRYDDIRRGISENGGALFSAQIVSNNTIKESNVKYCFAVMQIVEFYLERPMFIGEYMKKIRGLGEEIKYEKNYYHSAHAVNSSH